MSTRIFFDGIEILGDLPAFYDTTDAMRLSVNDIQATTVSDRASFETWFEDLPRCG
jgi:hypothetical protein